MERQNPYYMDYKKIYELFYGVNDIVTTESYSDEENSKLDQKMVSNVLQRWKLDDAWYKVPFTLIAGGHFTVGDKHFTKRTGLNFYEILFTINGCGVVETGGKTFNCTTSSLLLLDCNEKHYFHVNEGEEWEYKHIHFLANGDAKNVAERVTLSMVYDNDEVELIMKDLFSEYRHLHADSHFILSNYISCILTAMIKLNFKDSFSTPQERMVKSSAKYIRDHYNEKINLDLLAEQQFISTFYFVRLFKKYYGIPPYSYLTNYRLRQAQYMLLHQESVREIVTKCGFISANSFARTFKKQFGVSPTIYREKMGVKQLDPSLQLNHEIIEEKE